jgi:prepilin-type N-terminal cleavage/methylation domain-containing protein
MMSPRANPSRNQAGFTLTELVVTLAIAGVVGAIALPSLADLIRTTRVKNVATEMLSTLAYARNEAITRNVQVSVSASGTWSAGWRVTSNGTVLRQSTLNGDVIISGPTENNITYNPNGRLATLDTLSFSFSMPGTTHVVMRCVSATLLGQPVMQSDTNQDGDCSNG